MVTKKKTVAAKKKSSVSKKLGRTEKKRGALVAASIGFNIPDTEVARYTAAITAELDPAGTSGLTTAQLVKRYIISILKDLVSRYDRKQAEATMRTTLPPEVNLT